MCSSASSICSSSVVVVVCCSCWLLISCKCFVVVFQKQNQNLHMEPNWAIVDLFFYSQKMKWMIWFQNAYCTLFKHSLWHELCLYDLCISSSRGHYNTHWLWSKCSVRMKKVKKKKKREKKHHKWKKHCTLIIFILLFIAKWLFLSERNRKKEIERGGSLCVMIREYVMSKSSVLLHLPKLRLNRGTLAIGRLD